MRRAACVLGVCALGLATCALHAEGPEEAYRTVFGAEHDKVLATPGVKDDVEFGARLLDAANTSKDPSLTAYLYEMACDFACKALEGYPTALAAARLLCRTLPEKTLPVREKLLKAGEGLYARAAGEGDRITAGSYLIDSLVCLADLRLEANLPLEAHRLLGRAAALAPAVNPPSVHGIALRLETLKAAEAAQQRLARAEAALKANPQDAAAARRLLMAWLLEKDNPAKAAEYLGACGKDERLETYVPLASKGVLELEEPACLELANWYRGLAAQEESLGKLRALTRAQAYTKRFLELHKEADAKSSTAALLLGEIAKDLARVRGQMAGGWLDLLELVPRDTWNLEPQRWEATEEGLVTRANWVDLAMVSYEPPAEYDLEASFTRKGGIGPIGFMCPFGQTAFVCLLGDGNNRKAGLAEIRGNRIVPANPTVRDFSAVPDSRYSLLIQVRKKGIRVFLNQKPFTDYATDGSDLSPHINWNRHLPNPRVLGFGSFVSRVAFHCLWLKEVSGTGKFATSQPGP